MDHHLIADQNSEESCPGIENKTWVILSIAMHREQIGGTNLKWLLTDLKLGETLLSKRYILMRNQ